MNSSPKEAKSLPIRELAAVWGGNVMSKIMMFAATIWLANLLKEEGFGIYSTCFSLVNYLSLAFFTGLDTLTTRQAAQLPDTQVWPYARKLFTIRKALTKVLVLITALLAYILGRQNQILGLTLLAFGLSYIPQGIYSVNLFYGREWSKPVCLYFLGGRLIFLALIAILVKGINAAPKAALAFTLAITAENLFLYFLFRHRYKPQADQEAKAPVIPYKTVLLLTVLTALFSLHENAPQFLAYLFGGPKEAGLYASSFRLIYTAVTFANLGGFVFLARFTRQQGDTPTNSYRHSRRWAVIGGLACALAGYFLASPIYNLLFAQEYAAAVNVFKAGVLQMALVPVRVLTFQYLVSQGRSNKILAPLFLGVILSLLICAYLSRQNGAIGASAGLVLGELLITSLLLLKAR